VKPLSWRVQLGLIGLAYAGVLVVAAGLIFVRHLQELRNPVDAAGGMWAGGDLLLGIFIACLFMIPTICLVWFMAKFEVLYTRYSQLLLGLSLSAPICLGLFYFGKNHLAESVINACFCRLACSPFVLVGIGVSRLVARFDRPKKLTTYALLIEGLTLSIAVALLFIHAGDG
jgi:hypothetical protein